MENPVSLDVRVAAETASLLGEIGRQQHRSPDEMVSLAIDHYLALYQRQEEGIRAALREVAAGHTVPAEEVFAEFLSDRP